MSDYLLGIDLGTSSCKTALLTIEGKVFCSSIMEYPTHFPKKDWAEQQSDKWWYALVNTVKKILDDTGINPSKIIGVGIDSQGSVVLPVDKRGETLRPGLIWMDRRSEKQCKWIDENLKETLWKINGNHNDPSNIAPKILWIKDNEPDVYKNTYKFLHANGYLVFKLTSKFSMDISEGGLTQLFDTKNGCWSEELINGCEIDDSKLPDIYKCFEVVGSVTREAANITGLKEGTPVVAGSMDMVASALGTGVYLQGQAYVAAGTVVAAGVCLQKPKFNSALHIYHHIIPDMWLTAAGVDFGGGGLRWFNDLIKENNDYSEINKLVHMEQQINNLLVFLPYMVGQRAPLWNSNTRGVIFGLNPYTKKEELIRMFMEGSAFGLRYILDIIEQTGLNIEDIRMTGGCTRIKIWPQIFANIIKKNIAIYNDIDVALLGSAITAGYGVGVYRNFNYILSNFPIKKMYYPELDKNKLYESLYNIYHRLYDHIKEEFDLLAEVQEKYLNIDKE